MWSRNNLFLRSTWFHLCLSVEFVFLNFLFSVLIIFCPFVVVLYVFLRNIASNNPFDIFKLFLHQGYCFHIPLTTFTNTYSAWLPLLVLQCKYLYNYILCFLQTYLSVFNNNIFNKRLIQFILHYYIP